MSTVLEAERTVTLCLEYDTEQKAKRAAETIADGLKGDAEVMKFDGVSNGPTPVVVVLSPHHPDLPSVSYAIYVTGKMQGA